MSTARPPITGPSDRRRAIPATAADRRDAIAAALASLREEERRLVRLDLAPALANCRAERRYWQFLDAVHGGPGFAPSDPGAPTWPAPASR